MRRFLAGTIGLWGSALAGCAGAAAEPSGIDPASLNATAIVTVERSSGPSDSARPERSERSDSVVARFVRAKHGSVDDQALRVAGVDAEVPSAGSCIVPGAHAAVTTSGERGVELLDVGQVTVMSEGASMTVLSPRSMPDPAGVVSGVLYASKAPNAFAAGSKVSFAWPGGSDLHEGYALSVTAPRDPVDIRVAHGASGLDVTWDSSEADSRDNIYVDVASTSSRIVVRCASADQGYLRVPASLVTIDEGTVSVHRTHTEPFKARGIDPGEVRFDLASVVPFHR